MHGEIVFYTHGSTIECGGEMSAAGELTADILNFAPEGYRPIQRLLKHMKELARQYENTLERGVWWELNSQLIELRSHLMRYRVFLDAIHYHIRSEGQIMKKQCTLPLESTWMARKTSWGYGLGKMKAPSSGQLSSIA